MPLLPKRYPLQGYELKMAQNIGPQNMISGQFNDDIRVTVRNIGQGNWNEVSCNDEYKIIFDIGTNLHVSHFTMRTLVNQRFNQYSNSKPYLVLSHWDADHINCLYVLSPNELSTCFSGVYCINFMKSLLSSTVYNNLNLTLGRKVVCFDPIEKTIPISGRRFQLANYAALYIGERSRNINYAGLSLCIQGRKGSANLTGDIKLQQAQSVLNTEFYGNNLTNHLLVAPHHGGKYLSGEKEYAPSICQVAISVGHLNSYGHPESFMENYY